MPKKEIFYLQLTMQEAEQLLAYCKERDREGWYYDRKDYFEKRHNNITKQLKNMVMLKELRGY